VTQATSAELKMTAFLGNEDSPTIRNAIHSTEGAKEYGYQGALVGDGTGLDVVVVSPDRLPGLGAIERAIVGTPARHVKTLDAVVDPRHRHVGIEPIEPGEVIRFLLVHAANEEAAPAVALAVVETGARLVGFNLGDQLALAAVEVEGMKAVAQRQNGPASLPQRHRADVVW